MLKNIQFLLFPFIVFGHGCSFVQKVVFTIDNSVVLGEPQKQSDCVDFIGDVSKDCQDYLEAKKNCEEGDYDNVVIPLPFRDAKWGKELKRTCDEKEKASKEQAKQAQYDAVEKGNEAIQNASCGDLQEIWERHKSAVTDSYYATEEGALQNFLGAGKRFAECEHWDYLFTNIIHWGDSKGEGPQLIKVLVADGVDMEGQMLTFLKSNAMDFESAPTASMHYTNFLIENKKYSRCKEYVAPSSTMPDLSWEHFAFFFQESKCTAAANSVQKRLSSARADMRIMACRTLAKIGSRKHLSKMRSVAKSDSYFKEVSVVRNDKIYIEKEYTVRDICKESVEQLRRR